MPCFPRTRAPFKNLIDYPESGHSQGEFLRQFPSVIREMAVRKKGAKRGAVFRLISERRPAALTQSYTYDGVNRLSTVQESGS